MSQEESQSPTWCITSIDGRYRTKTLALAPFTSEAALILYRIRVEAAWLLFMLEIAPHGLGILTQLNSDAQVSESVSSLLKQWSLPIAQLKKSHSAAMDSAVSRVKAIEQTTNHDVKAVEYFLREELNQVGAPPVVLSLLHFACTSEDINNVAYALMLHEARAQILLPTLTKLVDCLTQLAHEHAGVAMLARTHGQTASPTTMGKEFAVFAHRLRQRVEDFKSIQLKAKFNGAVGNFNAHHSVLPQEDWPRKTADFLKTSFGLEQNPLTTQIENHDSLVDYLRTIADFNTVLIGFARDVWGYISLGYFRQITVAGEVGSSTMPHKVNPIDFENAEGNLGIAVAMARHFSDKLPISRWQRDLTDSTVLRAVGTCLAHSFLAYESILKGVSKLSLDQAAIAKDLNEAWEVLAEPIQTVMRAYGIVDAYERLKTATRGARVTQSILTELIDRTSELPPSVKTRLKALKPETYTGLASLLALGV